MDIEQEIIAIKDRNKKVEMDKAWETSSARKMTIFLLTYFMIVLFMYVSNIAEPWLNAVVPSLGFFFSTLTLPFVKKWWMKKNNG